MTQLPQRIYFRPNGEANSYMLIDQDLIKWVMALLLNGEHVKDRQIEILERMAACWNACRGVSIEALEKYHDNGGIEDAIDEDKDAVLDELQAQRDELLEALQNLSIVMRELHDHWDNDRDMKVGKGLLALSGLLPGYDKRIDVIHAAIAKATGGKA